MFILFSSFAFASLTNDINMYLSFDNSTVTGTTIRDFTIPQNNGSLMVGADIRDGNLNQFVNLDFRLEHIQIPEPFDLIDNNNYSIFGWAYVTNSSIPSVNAFYGEYLNNDNRWGWDMYPTIGGMRFFFSCRW